MYWFKKNFSNNKKQDKNFNVNYNDLFLDCLLMLSMVVKKLNFRTFYLRLNFVKSEKVFFKA